MKRKYRVCAFTIASGKHSEPKQKHIRFIKNKTLRDMVEAANRVARAIGNQREALIHMHCEPSFSLIGLLAKSITGAPLVCTVHSDPLELHFDNQHLRQLIRESYRASDVILAPSNHVARGVRKFADLSRGAVRTIPFGIDTRRFSCGEADRMGWPMDNSTISILVPARLASSKGHERLIANVFATRQFFPAVRFYFAGDGPTRPRIESLISRRGLTDTILLLGNVPNEKMPSLYRTVDAVMLPSRAEAFGIALVEAMACQRPVIGAAVGGIPEVVANGLTGWILDMKDLTAFRKILTYISSPAIRNRIGRSGRRRVEASYSVEMMMAAIEDVYQEALSARNGGRLPPRPGCPS